MTEKPMRLRGSAAMLAFGLVLALLVMACGNSATPSPSAPAASGTAALNGTWLLVSYTSPGGTQAAMAPSGSGLLAATQPTGDAVVWVVTGADAASVQRAAAAIKPSTLAGAFAFLLVVLVVVSWLAVRAERAHREADQRRRQAESLIGFMLGDLRTRLEAVNRLDALDAVGDRALDYVRVSEVELA